MKMIRIWFTLWCKRILKRPLFCLTLLLMPIMVFFLQYSVKKDDTMVRVALTTDTNSPDAVTQKLLKDMKALSNSSIRFYQCKNEEELRKDITSKTASCGYILPSNLKECLRNYTQKHEPYITALRGDNAISSKIVDEIVISKIYKPIAYQILNHFIDKKTGNQTDSEYLTQLFNKYDSTELLFQFEYADGTTNHFLSSKNTNYMLMPMRGIIALLILLACLTGALVWYTDLQKGVLVQMHLTQKRLHKLLSLLVPALFAGVIGLLTIKIAGISESMYSEIPAMLCYILSCMALTNFLRSLCRRQEFFLAAIPVLTIATLILCPVFINIETFLPVLGKVKQFLPTTHYLNALHSSKALLQMLLYSAVLSFLSAFPERING